MATLLVWLPLCGLLVVGIATPHGFNRLPAESVLEGALLCLFAYGALRGLRGSMLLLATVLLYLSIKVLLMRVFAPASLFDFLQAYKAYYYLAGYSIIVGARIFRLETFAKLTSIVLAMFAIKYGYVRFFGLSERPGILTENNFELTFLLGIFYIAYPHLGNLRFFKFAVLVATVLLSGSRSAALALVIVYIAIYVRSKSRWLLLHLLGVVLVSYLAIGVFMERLNGRGLESIDRYRFLIVFLREVQDWPWWEFLTGSMPLTPLSSTSCGSLEFYHNLFSTSSPGRCYSVVLHAFWLRVVFDHGVLGGLLLCAGIWLLLRRAGVPIKGRVVILALGAINGVSVSSFNSVFLALVIVFYITVQPRAEEFEISADGLPRSHLVGHGATTLPAHQQQSG